MGYLVWLVGLLGFLYFGLFEVVVCLELVLFWLRVLDLDFEWFLVGILLVGYICEFGFCCVAIVGFCGLVYHLMLVFVGLRF